MQQPSITLLDFLVTNIYLIVLLICVVFVMYLLPHMYTIQGLLIPAADVSTPYMYNTCTQHISPVNGGDTYCATYTPVNVDSASLVPPYTYNYQCGSTILTSYIPVFILGFSIQLCLPIVSMSLLMSVRYESMGPWLREQFHGIIWPEYWLPLETEEHDNTMASHSRSQKELLKANPRILLKTHAIYFVDVLNNWMLMLTFGFCSPMLAIAITCVILQKMCMWIVLIGRFTSVLNGDASSATMSTGDDNGSAIISINQDKNKNNPNCKTPCVHFALKALAEVHISLQEVLQGSFWRLVWCSAIFTALLCWDIAADDVWWVKSLWIPLAPICYTLLLRLVAWWCHHSGSSSSAASEKPTDSSHILCMSGGGGHHLGGGQHHSSNDPVEGVSGVSQTTTVSPFHII